MSKVKVNSAVNTVYESYSGKPPAWVLSMAEECEKSSQAGFASKIGRSPALVNQVLKNRYAGDLGDVRERVEAILHPSCIDCPILGEITGQLCVANQGKPYDPSNNLSVRLFVGCRKCPNRITKKGQQDAQ